MNDYIFALDIGTRTVTGILLEEQDDRFSIVDFCTKEHKERSMLDGQIHNVVAVADVIQDVKETLEQSYGKLHTVCVAAAGRALKTVQSTASITLNQQPIVENDTIKHLELSAVQSAQTKLATEEQNNDYSNYYCVGYSVLTYKLDDDLIGSLIDQSGDSATVEIIATFLPKVVVESLFAALGRADLQMEALTLEPIAAIHVLIPESMRRLNVALVDIGAGTSDIAITDRGTVVAYGMVPLAGDEITEAISDQYLLDFPKAEQTKRAIVNNGEGTVQDILGFETTITYETLVSDITSNIEKLADAIAGEIRLLNSTSPKAIMLVGGGSLTPNLTTVLARKLQLPANRVAIRGIEAIQNLKKADHLPTGPDFVTPIGIAIAAKQNPVHYVSITVNNKVIRLFEMKKLTVGDCLIQAGIDIHKWYGKPGIASIVTVNEKEITLPGSYGNAPKIYLNNNLVKVDTVVQNGDEIKIKKGKDGSEPQLTINELVGEMPTSTIFFNGEKYELNPVFMVNNYQKDKNYIIHDNDSIVLKQPKTVQDFLSSVSTEKMNTIKPFVVFVNKKKLTIDKGESHVYVNNRRADLNQTIRHRDTITVTSAKNPTVKDVVKLSNELYWDSITVTFNNELVEVKQQRIQVFRDQAEINENTIVKQHDHLELKKRNIEAFIFQDVFRYVDLDLSQVNGKFQLYLNQQPTTFYDPIHQGDVLEIKWD